MRQWSASRTAVFCNTYSYPATEPSPKIAGDLGIAESCLRRWMKAGDVGFGRAAGGTRDERMELVGLRRRNRVLEMEVEVLTRA